MRIPLKDYKAKYFDIDTSLVTLHINNRNMEVAEAPRHICVVTMRKMMKIIKEIVSYKMSYGSVIIVRPFSITSPCDREKRECLCGVCFKAII